MNTTNISFQSSRGKPNGMSANHVQRGYEQSGFVMHAKVS